MRLLSALAWKNYRTGYKENIPDGADGNESGGIGRLEILERVHGSLLGIVQLLGAAGATKDVRVTLVEAHTDLTVDTLLTELETVLDELTLRAEVVAVVELDRPVVGDELITESADLAVQDETLKVKMSSTEDSHSRG